MNYQQLHREYSLHSLTGEPIDSEVQEVHNFFLKLKRLSHDHLGKGKWYILRGNEFNEKGNPKWVFKTFENNDDIHFHTHIINNYYPKLRFTHGKDKRGIIAFFLNLVFDVKCSEDKVVLL